MKYSLIFLLLILSFEQSRASKLDSVRVEISSGQQFIIHEVDAKETLFSISRKYGVPVNDIRKHNPTAIQGLAIAQELKIPIVEIESKRTQDTSNNNYHVIESGDTFYSLSKKYELPIDSLQKWNDLKSTELNLGDSLIIGYKKTTQKVTILQELPEDQPKRYATEYVENVELDSALFHVVKKSETLYSIARDYGLSLEELRSMNYLNGSELSIGQAVRIAKKKEMMPSGTDTLSENTTVEEITEVDTVMAVPIDTVFVTTDNSRFKQRTEKLGNLDKTVEEGFAWKIPNTEDNRKYLALHRTAPLGTIIEVKNQMTDQSIFARVVGSLPETGINKNVLIRISHAAFERLNALDASIPVEIGYVLEDE